MKMEKLNLEPFFYIIVTILKTHLGMDLQPNLFGLFYKSNKYPALLLLNFFTIKFPNVNKRNLVRTIIARILLLALVSKNLCHHDGYG